MTVSCRASGIGLRPMQAPVLVVDQEADALEQILTALRSAGYAAMGVSDPMTALDAFESNDQVRVLVTRVDFGPAKLNGLSLARMVKHKRRTVKAVYVGRTEHGIQIDEAGIFIPHPVDFHALVAAVGRHLAAED